MADRRAEAVWEGDLIHGKGTITSVGSHAFGPLPVTWASRTEGSETVTSPEELLAAAHASCFNMALSAALSRKGTPPARLNTVAVCTFGRVGEGWKVTTVRLTVRGQVPGVDQAAFMEAAQGASQNCPISQALKGNVQISVDAALE